MKNYLSRQPQHSTRDMHDKIHMHIFISGDINVNKYLINFHCNLIFYMYILI